MVLDSLAYSIVPDFVFSVVLLRCFEGNAAAACWSATCSFRTGALLSEGEEAVGPDGALWTRDHFYERAKKMFERSVSLQPLRPRTLSHMALFLMDGLGMYAEAQDLLLHACRSQPDDPEVRFSASLTESIISRVTARVTALSSLYLGRCCQHRRACC